MVAEGDSGVVSAEPADADDRSGARLLKACSRSTNKDVANGAKTARAPPPKTFSENSDPSGSRRNAKPRGFRKAAELQNFTQVNCVRRYWPSGREESSNCDTPPAGDQPDELEKLAEEWTERLHRSRKFSAGNRRRHKQGSKKRNGAVGEKPFRLEDVPRGPGGYNGVAVIALKEDARARNAARRERLADVFAAKKANTEKRLKASKLERRGPPKNCAANTCGDAATVSPAQPVKYELREGDVSRFASSDDEAQFLRVLALVQHRDLLPEDYELLLRLDEGVSKKTLGPDRLRSLPTKLLTDADAEGAAPNSDFAAGASCAICMERYHADEVVKWLPCQHVFHSNCVDTWLGEAGSICPLDGLEV